MVNYWSALVTPSPPTFRFLLNRDSRRTREFLHAEHALCPSAVGLLPSVREMLQAPSTWCFRSLVLQSQHCRALHAASLFSGESLFTVSPQLFLCTVQGWTRRFSETPLFYLECFWVPLLNIYLDPSFPFPRDLIQSFGSGDASQCPEEGRRTFYFILVCVPVRVCTERLQCLSKFGQVIWITLKAMWVLHNVEHCIAILPPL